MKTTTKNRNEELHDVRTSFTIETKQQKQTIPHYDDWLHLIYSITFNGDWNITVQFQNIALKWHAIRFGTCIMCIYSNIYSIRVCSAQHVIHWNLQAFPNIGSTIEIPNMLQCSIWCVCVIRLNGWNTWAVARRLIENMFQTIDTNYAHNHSHNSIHAAHALPMFAIFRQKSILLPYTPNLIASNKFPFSYLAQLYLMHFHLGVCVYVPQFFCRRLRRQCCCRRSRRCYYAVETAIYTMHTFVLTLTQPISSHISFILDA